MTKNTYSFKVTMLALRKTIWYQTMTSDVLISSHLHREQAPLGHSHSVQWIGRWIKAIGCTQNEKVEAGTNKSHIPRFNLAPVKSLRNSLPTCMSFCLLVRLEKKQPKKNRPINAAPISLLIHSSPAQVSKSKYLLKYFHTILKR